MSEYIVFEYQEEVWEFFIKAIPVLLEECVSHYKNLFRYMKNESVDSLLLKARMIGSNDIRIE